MAKLYPTLFGGVFIAALFIAGLTTAWADPPCPVTRFEGRVESVDLSDPTNPKVVLNLLQPVGSLRAGARVTTAVEFTAGPSGCIDWTREENRAMAPVLSLKEGQLVDAVVLVPSNDQSRLSAGGAVPLARISPKQTQDPWAEAGNGKLKREQLLSQAEQGPVRVLVVLAGHGRLAAQMANPATRPRAAAEIKELQDRLLADIPADQFKVSNRLTNLAVLSGRATLAGLKALMAHDLVVSIEPDIKVKASGPFKMKIKEKKP